MLKQKRNGTFFVYKFLKIKFVYFIWRVGYQIRVKMCGEFISEIAGKYSELKILCVHKVIILDHFQCGSVGYS